MYVGYSVTCAKNPWKHCTMFLVINVKKTQEKLIWCGIIFVVISVDHPV